MRKLIRSFKVDEAVLECNLCDFQGHQGPIRIPNLRRSTTVTQVPQLLSMFQCGLLIAP